MLKENALKDIAIIKERFISDVETKKHKKEKEE